MLTDYGTLTYSRSIIKEIKVDRAEAVDFPSTNRLPDSRSVLVLLSRQQWASNLKQIPATVIDKGVLRNVPYISFRCGEDYEINIYGDPDHPAGVEAGVYRKLVEDGPARMNCLEFVGALLGRPVDKEVVRGLDIKKDLKTSDGLQLEITPPTAEDAYQGWWVSAYDESKLNVARASDAEMKRISVAKSDATKAADPTRTPSAWTAGELNLARPSTTGSYLAPPVSETARTAPETPIYSTPTYSPARTGGGSVYVRSYTRKDGTYVSGYSRGAPHSRR